MSGCESWQLGYSPCACASPAPIQLHLWAQQQIPLLLQTSFVVLEFKGSFWHKNLRWHMVWSRACAWFVNLQCKQRAAWALLSWAGIGTRSCHPGSVLIQTGILLISVGVLTNVRAMVSLYEKHPNKLILELTMDLIVFQNSFGV